VQRWEYVARQLHHLSAIHQVRSEFACYLGHYLAPTSQQVGVEYRFQWWGRRGCHNTSKRLWELVYVTLILSRSNLEIVDILMKVGDRPIEIDIIAVQFAHHDRTFSRHLQ
jgi:hypothetical protein